MLLCYCYSCCSTPMTQGPVTIIGEDEMAATCCSTRSSGMNVAFMLWCLMWGGPGLKYLCSGPAANFGPPEAEGGPRGAMSVGEERKGPDVRRACTMIRAPWQGFISATTFLVCFTLLLFLFCRVFLFIVPFSPPFSFVHQYKIASLLSPSQTRGIYIPPLLQILLTVKWILTNN